MNSILFKDKFFVSKVIFGVAAVILAVDPVLWLVRTWSDPSYNSNGLIVFCVCVGMFLWSVTSDRTAHTVNLRLPFFLLSVSSFGASDLGNPESLQPRRLLLFLSL